MITRLAIVVLFASLMGTAVAAAPGTQVPAQSAPDATQAPSPGKVINDILAVSGMKKTLDKMPENFVTAFRNGLQKSERPLPEDLKQAMGNSAKEAFVAGAFSSRVMRAMKTDYDEKRYREYLADLSTPLGKRMSALSNATNSDEEFANFAAQLATNPLPAQRAELLHRLNTASRSSDLYYTVLLSISKGMMRGMAAANGNCVSDAQLKQTEDALEEKLKSNKAGMESMAVNILAYAYRDVNDADLAEYLKMYEKEGTRHIHDVIYAAIAEEYNQASARMGRGIMHAVKSKKAAMGNQACADAPGANAVVAQAQVVDPVMQPDTPSDAASSASPAASAPAATEKQGEPATPKSSIPLEKRQGGDITQCLDAKSDKEIAACAEKFRKSR